MFGFGSCSFFAFCLLFCFTSDVPTYDFLISSLLYAFFVVFEDVRSFGGSDGRDNNSLGFDVDGGRIICVVRCPSGWGLSLLALDDEASASKSAGSSTDFIACDFLSCCRLVD
jgi:hypothetical protein